MSAATVTVAMAVIGWVRIAIDHLWGSKVDFGASDSLRVVPVVLVLGLLWFVGYFIWFMVAAIHAQPVCDILGQEAAEGCLREEPVTGFVAIEYYRSILNRTFVVFIAP